jgi:hypothetical protein
MVLRLNNIGGPHMEHEEVRRGLARWTEQLWRDVQELHKHQLREAKRRLREEKRAKRQARKLARRGAIGA